MPALASVEQAGLLTRRLLVIYSIQAAQLRGDGTIRLYWSGKGKVYFNLATAPAKVTEDKAEGRQQLGQRDRETQGQGAILGLLHTASFFWVQCGFYGRWIIQTEQCLFHD